MNKKGFTLVELLCVIALLSFLTVYASSNVVYLTRKGKQNLFCTKVSLIETIAKDYAINKEMELNNSNSYYEGYKSLTIKVDDLVKNGNIDTDKNDYIISPLDNSNMNDLDIILYLKNNNISAVLPNSIC